MNNDKKIAVFFDCENISAKYTQEIFDDLANHGEVIIRKAYDNWSERRSKSWSEKLQEFAIDPIQIFSNIANKNASDIKIVIDVMNIMNSSKVDIVALVSSDSDFTDLAKDIKSKGFEVMGYGEIKTHNSLRNAYSSFIELPINDELVSKNEESVISILKSAINSTKGDNDYVLISQIGTYLKNKEASLIAKNYGGNTWGDILKKFPNIFEVSHLDNRKSKTIVTIK